MEIDGTLHGSKTNVPFLVLLLKNSFMASVYGVSLVEFSGNSADTLNSTQIEMLGSWIPFPCDAVMEIDIWFSL